MAEKKPTTFPQCGSKGQATEEIRFSLFPSFKCFKIIKWERRKKKASPPERIGPSDIDNGKPAGGLNKIWEGRKKKKTVDGQRGFGVLVIVYLFSPENRLYYHPGK